MAYSTLPVVHFLNDLRLELHKNAYDSATIKNSSLDKTIAWVSHKILSAACIAIDAVAVATTLAAFTVISCPLGFLKIFVFAITAGKVQLKFSTLANTFLEHTDRALADLFWSVVEPFQHALYFFKTAYDVTLVALKWVGEKLHLDQHIIALVTDYFKRGVSAILKHTLIFALNRITRGFELASSTERPISFTHETVKFIRPLDQFTRDLSVMSSEERSIGGILLHYPLSVINIAVNAAVGTFTLITAVAGTVAYLAKAALGTLTGLKLPVATFASASWNITLINLRNILYDATSDIADTVVLIFKIAQALKINHILYSIGQLLSYCVKAIFS